MAIAAPAVVLLVAVALFSGGCGGGDVNASGDEPGNVAAQAVGNEEIVAPGRADESGDSGAQPGQSSIPPSRFRQGGEPVDLTGGGNGQSGDDASEGRTSGGVEVVLPVR